MHSLFALCVVGVGQLLRFVDRNAAFHELFHVIPAKKLAAVGVDDAGRMMLGNAIKAQLLGKHQHGRIHIDSGQHSFDFFSVVVHNTRVLRHFGKTNKLHNNVIHFFNGHFLILLLIMEL